MRVYEVRAAYNSGWKKIRAWKEIPHRPTQDDINELRMDLRAACCGVSVDTLSETQVSELLIDRLGLSACEVCDIYDEGVVIYKDWP